MSYLNSLSIYNIILIENYSKYKWSISGNSYEEIKWDSSNSIPKPTKDELNILFNQMKQKKPLKKLRQERNKKLDKTDKYLTSDFVYPSGVTKQNWLDYRQALRDLPSNSQPELDQNGNLINVEWPTPPS